MPDFFHRIDTTLLFPPFVNLCRQLVSNCHTLAYDYYAICGFRDGATQDVLYSIGRTTQLDHPVVTNAAGYTSYHNYGLAIDFCRNADISRDTLTPDYAFADYKLLADEAMKLNLTPGYYFTHFPEGAHVQFNTTVPLWQMKQIMQNGGKVSDVWNRIS